MKKSQHLKVEMLGFNHFKRLGDPERSLLPSLTQPEQLTPLEKILSFRNQGIPVPTFHGVFSEIDTPDLYKMDFVEIAQLKDDTNASIAAAKEDLHAINVRMEELLKPLPTKEEIETKAPDGAKP